MGESEIADRKSAIDNADNTENADGISAAEKREVVRKARARFNERLREAKVQRGHITSPGAGPWCETCSKFARHLYKAGSCPGRQFAAGGETPLCHSDRA